MLNRESTSDVPLPWARRDVEQRLWVRGGRYTRVNNALAAFLGLLLTVVFYGVLVFAMKGSVLTSMFIDQGPTPYAIVFLSSWSVAILFLKWRKLSFQRRALAFDVTPRDSDFVLSAGNVDQVIDRIYGIADDPRHFVLYNRIVGALANLKNLGRVGDLDEILNTQAENDEAAMETSYGVLAGFVWAIPVLGFIGTVLGLSAAISEFSAVLGPPPEVVASGEVAPGSPPPSEPAGGGEDMDRIKGALVKVTSGLSTAFVTTLQALIAALGIQLALTFLKKSEQEFLEECHRYCLNQIVNRLRILPYERPVPA